MLEEVPALKHWGFAIHHFQNYVNRSFQPHSLDVALLSFMIVRKGSIQHMIGDEVFEETGAAIDIIHYGQAHDIITGPEGVEIYNVYMDLKNHPLPPLPPEFTSTLPMLFPLHPAMGNRLNRQIRIPIANPAPLTNLLDRWMHEEHAPGPGSEWIARSSLHIFLIECCRIALAEGFVLRSPHQENSSSIWLERVRRVLDEKFAERQSLNELAALARVTPQHLSREFRRYSGKPLIIYLNQRRIESAMLRLRTTRDKIVGIAMECGFEDLSHFNRVFRRMTGATPSAYRKSFQASPNNQA
jgi:AraC-like DNA-binding protein